MLAKLLSHLRALFQLEHHMHWKSSGENYFGDHLLFERLYKESEDLIDGVAEKSIGVFGPDSIDTVEDAEFTKVLLSKWQASTGSFPAAALAAVKATLSYIDALLKELRDADKATEGMENLIQGVADKLESHVYLLTQRTSKASILASLTKIANALDKKGAFDEADAIDKLITSLATSRGTYNTFIKAIKDNDFDIAIPLLSHLSPSELDLSDQDFRDLLFAVQTHDSFAARVLLGIGNDEVDPDLGRPIVSPHLKTVFSPKK